MNFPKILTTLALSALLFTASQTEAGQVSPSIVDILIQTTQSKDGLVSYKNTSKKKENLRIEVLPYDPQKGQFLSDDGKVFIQTAITEVSLEPEESVEINYTAVASPDMALETYFNVIAIIDADTQGIPSLPQRNDGTVGFQIRKGEGALIAMHVVSGPQVLGEEDLSVELKNNREWFIPFLMRPSSEVSIVNNSNYPLELSGEFRVISENGKILSTIPIRDLRLYSNQEIEKELSAEYLGFENVSIVYRLATNLDIKAFEGSFTMMNYGKYVVLSILTFFAIAVISVKVYQKYRLRHSEKSL